MKRSRSLHNQGLSLIELVIAVAIVGVIGVGIAKFQGDIFSYNRYFQASFSSAEKAQRLLRPMTEEVRSASPSSTGAYPINDAAEYDFSFYSDIDNDGLKELVRYYVSGTNFIKEVTKPTGNPLVYQTSQKVTSVFMTNVRNLSNSIPVFTYYDDSYTGGSQGIVPGGTGISTIRMVRITIRIDADTNKPPAPLDITSQVSIRNLKQQQ